MNETQRPGRSAFGKAAAAAFALALAGALIAGLSGCGQNQEELIRDGVESEFAELKAMEGDTWSDVMDGMNASMAMLMQYGIDGEEVARALLEGFDYQLKEVSVDGSTATVQVETSCKSFASAEELFEAKVQEYADEAAEGADNAMVGQLLMESLAECPMETTTIVLPYELKGSTWEPAEGYEAAVASMFGM